MNKVVKKTKPTNPLSPGEYVATVTNVTIKQVDDGTNVFWSLNVNGESHTKPNFVRKTKGGQNQIVNDAKLFGITVTGLQDLTEANFSKAIDKQVEIKVTDDNPNPKYPNIYFKKMLKNKDSLSTWDC